MQTVYLHAPTCAHPCYVCSDWQGLSDLHGLYVQVRNPTGTGHLLVTRTKPLPAYGFLWVCGGARLPD